MSDEDEDEYTPRDRGLLVGYAWMAYAAHGGDDDLIAGVLDRGEVPESLTGLVLTPDLVERLDASAEADAYTSFWGGFIHGARAFVIERDRGLGRN
jgi:hypothetical protein